MTTPLTPFPLQQNSGELLTDDLTAWASDDWEATGDEVIKDCWGDTDDIKLFVEMLAYWGNNPEVEQSPAARSTRLTKTYTQDNDGNPLPANRLIVVSVGVAFYAQDFGAAGKWVGMEVNGVQFAPSVTASGTLTPNVGTMIGYGITNSEGELEVAFGCDDITVSCDLHIHFDNIVLSSPDIALSQIFYDAAVLYVSGNPVSITRDGFSFDPQEVRESYDYPGKANEIEGLEEIVSARPVLRGAFMLSGEYQFTVYRPGGAWGNHASVSGGRTYTIPQIRSALTTGLSLTSVLAIWRRPSDYLVVEFPKAICRSYSLSSRDKDEGTIPVEIAALVPNGSSSKTTPYKLHTFPLGTEL